MSYVAPPPPADGPPPRRSVAKPLLLGGTIGLVATLLGVPLGFFGLGLPTGGGMETDVLQVALGVLAGFRSWSGSDCCSPRGPGCGAPGS